MTRRADTPDQAKRSLVLALYSSNVRGASLLQRLQSDRFEVISSPLTNPARWHDRLEPDLIVLDLPEAPLELVKTCRAIRALTDRPVVVLSERSDELVITRALAAGVDDYLVEPVSGNELAARVAALLRRGFSSLGQSEPLARGVVLLADDLSAAVDGRTVHLSPTEFRLLSCLASKPGKVFTHQTLMSRVWGAEYVDARHYLHVYIGYLRDKLETDPAHPTLIVNAWGVGYKLQLPAARPS